MPNYITHSQTQGTNTPAQNTRSQANIFSIMDKVVLLCAQITPTLKIDPKQAAIRKYPVELLCEIAGAVLDPENGNVLEY